jgi:hypothetical protein
MIRIGFRSIVTDVPRESFTFTGKEGTVVVVVLDPAVVADGAPDAVEQAPRTSNAAASNGVSQRFIWILQHRVARLDRRTHRVTNDSSTESGFVDRAGT